MFRVVGDDEATMSLMEAINASGTAYLSHTKVEGRAALRLATGGWRTTDADIDRTWEALVGIAGYLRRTSSWPFSSCLVSRMSARDSTKARNDV